MSMSADKITSGATRASVLLHRHAADGIREKADLLVMLGTRPRRVILHGLTGGHIDTAELRDVFDGRCEDVVNTLGSAIGETSALADADKCLEIVLREWGHVYDEGTEGGA